MRSSEPDATPPRLGPYRLEHRLGRGGMGEVYQGFDERLERAVALKRVHPERADEQTVERLRREAKAIARLSHPAIVQVHDWVDDPSGHWIVMELVPGRSLREAMATGRLPLDSILRLARDIAAGLQVAHRAGIVHRDLKPDNVMVTDDGSAKILDFGLAKHLQLEDQHTSLTIDGKILGTVTAMSPEQGLGHAVDQRSDLFSFGTLLYEMVSGLSPFRAATPMETLTRICTWRQAPVSEWVDGLPPTFDQLIDQLLEKEPVRRPTATQVLTALRALIAEPGMESASRPSAAEAMQDWPSTREVTLDDGDLPGSPPDGHPGHQDLPTTALTSTWRKRRSWWLPSLIAALSLGSALWLVARGRDGVSEEQGKVGSAVPLTTVNGSPSTETPSDAPLLQVDLERLDDYPLYRHGMLLLERYDKEGHIDRAIEAFQRLLARQPESAPGHAGLARAYWEKYKNASKDPQWLAQARAVATRGVALDPFLVAGRISLAWVLLEDGEPETAAEELHRVLQLEPGNADALRGLAERELVEGRLGKAEELYRQSLASAPESWSVLARLGSLLYRMGRLPESEEVFLRCLDLVPDSLVCQRNLAGVYFSQGRYADAAASFQRALEIRPAASLYANLGTLLFYQGLYPQAVEAFEQALARGANDHRLWANAGDAYRWNPGSGLQASEAYRRAIQLIEDKLDKSPEDLDSRSRLGLYLAKLGDCARASEEIGRLSRAEASDGAVYFRKATVDELCGRRGAALENLGLAIQGGYSLEDIQRDPELLRLRSDPAYHRLLVQQQGS